MNNSAIIGFLAWFIPGAGHIAVGDVKKGIIIGAVIWSMFIIAVLSGGAYYPGLTFEEAALLYLLNGFARIGNGLGALISIFLNMNPPTNVAAWGTFEYGGRFLEVAGLLNYLAIIDVFDIYLGRKE